MTSAVTACTMAAQRHEADKWNPAIINYIICIWDVFLVNMYIYYEEKYMI